jgi:hypothetical protein
MMAVKAPSTVPVAFPAVSAARRRLRWVGLVLGIAVAGFAGLEIVWRQYLAPGIERALPFGARAVRSACDPNKFPDFDCYLRARLTQGEFAQYAHRLGLRIVDSPLEGGDRPEWNPPVDGFHPPEWWNPSRGTGAAIYVSHGGRVRTLAKYEGGLIYVRSSSR